MVEQAQVKRVKRCASHLSNARCSLCGYNLWLAPGSDGTIEEVLSLHVEMKHKETL